jgi:hypothetical protein
MSVQDIWSKEVTITPSEVAPQIVVEKTDIERIEEGSDKESEEEEKRAWKRSRVEMEDVRKVVVRDMFGMTSDDDEEDAPVNKKDDRRASCPILGCDWTSSAGRVMTSSPLSSVSGTVELSL